MNDAAWSNQVANSKAAESMNALGSASVESFAEKQGAEISRSIGFVSDKPSTLGLQAALGALALMGSTVLAVAGIRWWRKAAAATQPDQQLEMQDVFASKFAVAAFTGETSSIGRSLGALGRTGRLALAAGVALCCYSAGQAFVGAPAVGRSSGLTAARVSAEYLERQGPKDADVAFTSSAATGPTTEVEFKKRPFGILRYQPGQGMKGAMVMEIIPQSRYPGDPQGQAFSAGLKGGSVMKSINGVDVTNEDFGKIMDLLDDEVADPRFSKSTALALEKQGGRLAEPAEAPIKIVFAEIPGYQGKFATLTADGQDGFAR
jgi:hypothetical protein